MSVSHHVNKNIQISFSTLLSFLIMCRVNMLTCEVIGDLVNYYSFMIWLVMMLVVYKTCRNIGKRREPNSSQLIVCVVLSYDIFSILLTYLISPFIPDICIKPECKIFIHFFYGLWWAVTAIPVGTHAWKRGYKDLLSGRRD